MIKNRDWTISADIWMGGCMAVHDSYDVSLNTDGSIDASHPVIYGKNIQDCIEQIDDWYEENKDE